MTGTRIVTCNGNKADGTPCTRGVKTTSWTSDEDVYCHQHMGQHTKAGPATQAFIDKEAPNDEEKDFATKVVDHFNRIPDNHIRMKMKKQFVRVFGERSSWSVDQRDDMLVWVRRNIRNLIK